MVIYMYFYVLIFFFYSLAASDLFTLVLTGEDLKQYKLKLTESDLECFPTLKNIFLSEYLPTNKTEISFEFVSMETFNLILYPLSRWFKGNKIQHPISEEEREKLDPKVINDQ